MPRAPDSTTDTYLEVLRTLGVTDAALRRHHDAAPETPLRVAIDGDRGAPTADLLSALAATGRVLDLRDGLAGGDGDRLAATLGRFGYAIECSAANDADSPAAADESDGLELRVRDVVTGDVESLHTAPDAAAVEATLREELLAPLDVELAELLDGRHLVAEARELRTLAAGYGDRIEPFDDPLLVPDAAIDVEAEGPPAGAAPTDPVDSTVAGETSGADTGAPTAPASAEDDGESFGEALAEADDATTDTIEAALSQGGPSRHTIEGDDDLDSAAETTVGGGPRRTVSTTGIDEVFDQLESSTVEADPAGDDGDAADPRTTKTTMADSSDSPTDASAQSDDAGGPAEGLSGGPKRTVSTTSADDILARATGERDFETIAAEEGDADPDAVLAEGEVPPALEDSGVTPTLSSEAPDAETGGDESAPPSGRDESETEAAEASVGSDEAAGAADRPPADPAAAPSTDESGASSGDGADERTADEVLAAPGPGGADGAASADDADPVPSDDVDPAVADDVADPATPMPPAGNDRDEREQSDEANATPDPAELGDELLDEDVELPDGSESVDEPAPPGDDPVETADDADEPAAADGPLAARGGLRPDDGSSEPETGDGPAAADRSPADATGDDRAGDAPASDTPAAGDPTTDHVSAGSGEIDEEDADAPAEASPSEEASTEDESTDDGGDTGLVGRITSTIFGR